MGLFDIIQQQLGPSAVTDISRRLGVNPAIAQTVVNAALPAVIAGMARHASHPAGEAQIHDEVKQHGMPGTSEESQATSAGPSAQQSQSPASGSSGGFLDRVLGTHADMVRQKIGEATGTDPRNADKLVMVLAPAVIAAIAHERKRQGGQAGSIGQALEEAHAQAIRA